MPYRPSLKKQKSVSEKQRHGVSRRGFLAGVGAGVAGVAFSPAEAAARALTPRSAGLLQATDRFGRIFNLGPFADMNASSLQGALMQMGQPGGVIDAQDPLEEGPVRLITNPELSPNNLDNPTHTAGTTFFGQFLDHDMTFDESSPLGSPTPPEDTQNTRTPGFDLDSVYGQGPTATPQYYDPDDPDKFLLESGGLFEDLPRRPDNTAIIADRRNDENLIVSGLQTAFLRFHNNVVDLLRDEGEANAFTAARQLVRWHYQWIILHEFLPLFVGQETVDQVLQSGRQYYNPAPGSQFIPVEFQGAVYRFGHSMVRPSYRANLAGDNGEAFFGFIFDPAAEGQADPDDLRGGERAPRRFIGWQTFFDFGDGEVRPNKRIDTKLSTPLFDLPLRTIPSQDPPTSLPQRNLLRHVTWSIPGGQQLAQTMGIEPLWAQHFPELQQFGHGLASSTPLWYYALKEAEVLADGEHLAGVGARIVAEVFIGLLQLDPLSYLSSNPGWTPTLPRRSGPAGDFTIVDLLTFAEVDPDSRGQ